MPPSAFIIAERCRTSLAEARSGGFLHDQASHHSARAHAPESISRASRWRRSVEAITAGRKVTLRLPEILAHGWTARFGLLNLAMVRSLGVEGKVYAGMFAILPEKVERRFAAQTLQRFQPASDGLARYCAAR